MGSFLSAVAGWFVNWLLGKFFPAHPKVTPEVIAQAQKDRADTLQSQKDARHEAETVRRDVAGRAPDELRQHDANEYDPDKP